MKRKGFTLIEMLTVIFITAIMMGIIIVPFVQSFNITRAAQGVSDAQDKARLLVERISREINNSAGVRDNEDVRGSIGVRVPGQDGMPEVILLPYSKLDVLKTASGDPSDRRDGAFINPDRNIADPTQRAPRGDVLLPTAPGATIVRYWIGLQDPLQAYLNPFDGLLMAISGKGDNLYVLYRAEIQPIIVDAGGNFLVNTTYFRDTNGDNIPDDIDDPYFFLPNAPGDLAADAPAKLARIKAWRSAATVMTEVARYDMIQPIYNKGNRQVRYTGNIPQIMSLVQFRPTRVSAEPAQQEKALRLGEESDNLSEVASDVFRSKYGSWSSAAVRLFPFGWSGGAYVVGRSTPTPTGDRFRIFRYDPTLDPDGDDRNGEGNPADDVEYMDVTTYEEFISTGRVYAFTRAILDSNGRSNWLSNPAYRALFVPFVIDKQEGKVMTAFPVSEIGIDNPAGGVRRPDNNVPTVGTGLPLVPTNDPAPPGNFYDYENELNRRFNKVWADNPSLRPNVHRFLDLRVVKNADGTDGVLHPVTGFPNAQIVPGSEVVVGPDQNPGSGYGAPIRYFRTTREPGPNQYRINFVDQKEPADYSLLGFPNPPPVYDRQNFVSAIIQPRFKAGYLQLNSDPAIPLPNGNITVFYRFQFTRPGDSVTVDYDTRRVLTVLLTVKNYPNTTLPNTSQITLSASAAVRNYAR